MSGRWGALIGLAAGVVGVGLVVFLPRAPQGLFYEIGDVLLVMGIPLLVVGTAIGAMAGAALGHRSRSAGESPRSAVPLVAGMVAGLLAILAATSLFLWGTGLLYPVR